MDKVRRVQLFEIFLYVFVLMVALGIPFLSGGFTNIGWKVVWLDWLRIVPFILVFIMNNFVMAPKLLFRGKFLHYIFACILLIIAVVYLSDYLFNMTRSIRPPFESMQGHRFSPGKIPAPPLNGIYPPWKGDFPPIKSAHHFFNFGLAIVSLLLIGFNTGIKSFVRWNEERIRQAEKDRYHFLTELAYLKHQISPHFFMNTLNNIHALVDINTEEAKEAIIKLSHLMRYLLYEADMQKVNLEKEIMFIESYIKLMRLRYDEKSLMIKTEYPACAQSVFVPPFLFLPFIENAFKHGINTLAPSLIEIRFHVDGDWLTFDISNNKSGIDSVTGEASGIGLENVQKRLDLVFDDKYTLDIKSTENKYDVKLIIPLLID